MRLVPVNRVPCKAEVMRAGVRTVARANGGPFGDRAGSGPALGVRTDRFKVDLLVALESRNASFLQRVTIERPKSSDGC